MAAAVPPYFDKLVEGFRDGAERFVHLGYWDAHVADAAAPLPGEFARAQARLNEVLLEMAQVESGQAILDVGCGLGGTLDTLNRTLRDADLAGVNIDPRQLAICARIEPAHGNRLAWRQADACRLPFGDASFDRVLCIEAMFHFASRRAFFQEAARVLKPGGVLAVSDIVLHASARAADSGEFPLGAWIRAGFGPWPDLWSEDADHGALGAAAGLRLGRFLDATAQTRPSHRFTVPPAIDARTDPGDATVRAAVMLRWLHRNGHLRYPCLRFDKAA